LFNPTGRPKPEIWPEYRLTEFRTMASFMPTARAERKIRVETAVTTINDRTAVERPDRSRNRKAVLVQNPRDLNI
jgi:hypothetical protein